MKQATRMLSCLAVSLWLHPLASASQQTGNHIENKMAQMHLTLPQAPTPAASFVPYRIAGNLVFISGQLPQEADRIKFIGKLGDSISDEDGTAAARLAALNVLAQLKAAVGSLDKVKRCVKLTGFVNSTADFTAHSRIINGASDLIVELFGEKGKHARAAIGVSSLPFGSAVEVEAIFEIEQ